MPYYICNTFNNQKNNDMDTEKLDLNNGQENKKNKKNEGIDGSGIALGAGGLVAAGVVGGQLLNEGEEAPAEVEEPTGPVSEPAHPQTQVEQPQPQEEEIVVIAEPAQEQVANVNEPTPIAPDRPGVATDQMTSTTDDLIVDADITNPNEEELVAIAEQIVNDPAADVQDVAMTEVTEVTMDDIFYTETGDELAMNDHAVEAAGEDIEAEAEMLDTSEVDLLEDFNDPIEEEESAMEDFESPEDLFEGGDDMDDILSDISYDAPDEG